MLHQQIKTARLPSAHSDIHIFLLMKPALPRRPLWRDEIELEIVQDRGKEFVHFRVGYLADRYQHPRP